MTRRFYFLWLLLLTASSVLSETEHSSKIIRIAVTSSFRPAMEKLVPIFEKNNSFKVAWKVASSGSLFSQIKNGAPYDLFLSANSLYPKKLAGLGFADESTRTTYALGLLAWWQPQSESVSLMKPVNFIQPIALANKKLAPYGRAAEEVISHLEKNGSSFSKKVYGSNISQTYQFIASGNAVGGFVAYSYLLAAKIKSSYWLIPTVWHKPIEQQAIVIKTGKSCLSKQFLIFLQRASSRKIISQLGYSAPPNFNMLEKPALPSCPS